MRKRRAISGLIKTLRSVLRFRSVELDPVERRLRTAVRDKAIRPIIDKHWTEMFPDAARRPPGTPYASTSPSRC